MLARSLPKILLFLARGLLKILLFCGLFYLSVRYVHTYPLPLTLSQQGVLIDIADAIGVVDYEALYIDTMLVIDLAVTIVVYIAIKRLWRRYRTPRR